MSQVSRKCVGRRIQVPGSVAGLLQTRISGTDQATGVLHWVLPGTGASTFASWHLGQQVLRSRRFGLTSGATPTRCRSSHARLLHRTRWRAGVSQAIPLQQRGRADRCIVAFSRHTAAALSCSWQSLQGGLQQCRPGIQVSHLGVTPAITVSQEHEPKAGTDGSSYEGAQ